MLVAADFSFWSHDLFSAFRWTRVSFCRILRSHVCIQGHLKQLCMIHRTKIAFLCLTLGLSAALWNNRAAWLLSTRQLCSDLNRWAGLLCSQPELHDHVRDATALPDDVIESQEKEKLSEVWDYWIDADAQSERPAGISVRAGIRKVVMGPSGFTTPVLPPTCAPQGGLKVALPPALCF